MARTARPVTGITDFVYGGNALVADYTNAGALLRRAACPERSQRVHGNNVEADDPLIVYEGAAVSNATRRYLHADPRGSIVAVTDHQGNTLSTNAYDEYGIPDAATQAAGSAGDISTKGRFRYTGQAYIPELGMYYYKARVYSPTLGRFLQTDPIGYEDQFNLYAYVGNDPINGVDPTGEFSCAPDGCSRASFDAYQRAVSNHTFEIGSRHVDTANAAPYDTNETVAGRGRKILKDLTCAIGLYCGTPSDTLVKPEDADQTDRIPEQRPASPEQKTR